MLALYHKFVRRARAAPIKTLRRAWSILRVGGVSSMLEVARTYADVNRQYQAWRKLQQPRYAVELQTYPLISIVTPTYNSDERGLRRAIESVLAQRYPHWELCIADDASTQLHVRAVLEEYAGQDSRIRVSYRDLNGHISAASNTALKMAHGDYIALLDHDDEISPDALLEIAALLDQHPEADFIYSDEDKIEPDGVTYTEPFFKPGWSPRLLLTCNYITHFAVIRRSLVEQVGGFRDAFVGSQDHDLFLRVTDHTDRVFHIPKMLYSWRKSVTSAASGAEVKPYALDAAFRAVADTIRRRGLNARAERGLYPPFLRVRPAVPLDAHVSVLRPPRGANPMPTLMDAAEKVTGDYLLFLPYGVHLSEAAVTALLEWASQPDVGCVGGKIVSPQNKLVHAGIAVSGAAGDDTTSTDFPGRGMHDVIQAIFYFNLKDTIREVSAVSWACMMVAREKFLQIGGFDRRYHSSLFDVDLCLRLMQNGYANVYTPFARMVVQRPGFLSIDASDARIFHRRWNTTTDPYIHPRLRRSDLRPIV